MSSSESPANRQSFWQNQVLTWQDSGLNKARYCREHKLNYQQFIYWSAKFGAARRSSSASNSQAPKFLPVAVTQQAVLPELQIRLPNGVVISGISVDSVDVVGALVAQL